MNAEELCAELRFDLHEMWLCRERADILDPRLVCGRPMQHDGDHAQLAKGHPFAVTVWPSD